MRRIAPSPQAQTPSVDTQSVSTEIDLKELLDKCRLILQREIRNLSSESTEGRLSKDASQSLVNYIKLLQDLIKKENELFDSMTDEQIKDLIKDKE